MAPYQFCPALQGTIVTGKGPFTTWKFGLYFGIVEALISGLGIFVNKNFGYDLIWACVVLHVSTFIWALGMNNKHWFEYDLNVTVMFVLQIANICTNFGLVIANFVEQFPQAYHLPYSIFALVLDIVTVLIFSTNFLLMRTAEENRKREQQQQQRQQQQDMVYDNIWTGFLRFSQQGQQTENECEQVTHQIPCSVTAKNKALNSRWPTCMFINFVPNGQSATKLGTVDTFLFYPMECQAREALFDTLRSGYVGLVKITGSTNKILLFVYDGESKSFLGLIPENQEQWLVRHHETQNPDEAFISDEAYV